MPPSHLEFPDHPDDMSLGADAEDSHRSTYIELGPISEVVAKCLVNDLRLLLAPMVRRLARRRRRRRRRRSDFLLQAFPFLRVDVFPDVEV